MNHSVPPIPREVRQPESGDYPLLDSTSDLFQFDLLREEKKRGKRHFYRFLDQFPASADESKLYQADSLREEHLHQTTLVTCRECGKRRARLDRHVLYLHKMTLEEYLEKWHYAPLCAQSVADEARKRKEKWGAQHGGNYFGGKRHVLKRSERRRRDKPPTPEMRRRWMRLSEKYAGKARLSTRSKQHLVDDATLVELRLAGMTYREIGEAVGLKGRAVWQRLGYLGFPSGNPCRFLHGEPLARKHFADLRSDFGTTMLLIARSVAENADYEVKRKGGTYFGGKIHYPSGKVPRTYYNSLSNCLSRHKPEDVLPVRFADLVLDVRRRWTEAFCVESVAGKRVRNFLASELRDLPIQQAQLLEAMRSLRTWLRARNGSVKPSEILNWICDQSREEVATRKAGLGFRALMFLWPELKDVNEKRPGLLAGRRFIGEGADELLARAYGAAPFQIHCAAHKKFTPLDPRTLGQRIRGEFGRAAEDAAEKRGHRKKRGRRGELLGDTPARITVAAYLRLYGTSDYQMAAQLYPLHSTKPGAWNAAKTFFRRQRDNITQEQLRLGVLPKVERMARFAAAQQKLSRPS